LLTAMLAAAIGLPVFIEPVRDLSQLFPCMHHRCGCASAEACWRKCCCLSSTEKLAWAEEHGVLPPEYVLAEVSLPAMAEVESHPACGSKCCESAANLASEKPPAQESLGLVLLSDYSRCQGFSTVWLTLGHALPFVPRQAIVVADPLPRDWLRNASQPNIESRAISPVEPPPWRVPTAA